MEIAANARPACVCSYQFNSQFKNPALVGIFNGTDGSRVAASSIYRRWQCGGMPHLQFNVSTLCAWECVQMALPEVV